jgi:class 3 adenylate cyclase
MRLPADALFSARSLTQTPARLPHERALAPCGGLQHARSARVLCTLLAAETIPGEGAEMPAGRPAADLDAYITVVRDTVNAHVGRLLNPGDHGILATFDGPARAIRCAAALRDQMTGLGVQMRIGIHCGEADDLGDAVSGIAVDITTQLAEMAHSGEVLVSRTVKDLVAGSGISFTDRGTHQLPDLPDRWAVFADGQA